MTNFYGWTNFHYSTKKKTVPKQRDIFDFEKPVFLPVFDSCTTFGPLIKFYASCYSRFTSLAFFAVIPLKEKSQTFSNESTYCRACFNNNTTILKRFYSGTMITDREVSLGRTSYVFSSALVFISIKHVFLTFSLRAFHGFFNFWHGQVRENPSTPLERAP